MEDAPFAGDLTWSSDSDGRLEQVEITLAGPAASESTMAVLRAVDAPDLPEVLPVDADLEFADLPAVEVVSQTPFTSSECLPPGTDTDAVDACIEDALRDQTIGEWIDINGGGLEAALNRSWCLEES